MRVPGWSGTCYVAKDDLKILILLPSLPELWDCQCVPPCLVYDPGTEPGVL